MNQQVNKSNQPVGQGAEENNQVDNPIRATDSSRNDERDERVRQEEGTKRLRSERDSVKGRDEE
jgi:hypothetical protein